MSSSPDGKTGQTEIVPHTFVNFRKRAAVTGIYNSFYLETGISVDDVTFMV